MKICMITQDFPPKARGAGQYAYKLAKGLRDRGHEVVVLTRGSNNALYTLDNFNGINVYRVRFVKAYPFHLELHKKFIEKLLREKIKDCDILHLHTPSVPAVQIRDIPVLSTFHGTAYGSSKRRGYKDVYSIGIKLSLPLLIDTEKRIIMSSESIIAVSLLVKMEIIKYYNPDKKIEIIHNFVDTGKFIPSQFNENKRKTQHLLYVGSLDYLKGVLDLIHAFKIISKERGNRNVRLFIFGNGPLEGKLRSILKTNNLRNDVCLFNYLKNDKLVEYYQNATIFILPSYYEGSPTVLLEAMACGVPVIATRVGGIPELIKDGKTGLLVPPGDPKALAEAIVYLLDNEKERRRLGKNGRKLVEKNHSIDKMVKKYLDIYKEVQK